APRDRPAARAATAPARAARRVAAPGPRAARRVARPGPRAARAARAALCRTSPGSGASDPRMIDRLKRVPPWAWALGFALVLCLPRLGSFGFWDPSELKLAEQAREIARSGHLLDPTVGGRFPARPPLDLSLAALGIRMFGASEWGARVFFALSSVAALMAVYWAGAGLLRRRAGLLAALALGTMPLFALEARQLTSDAPLIA